MVHQISDTKAFLLKEPLVSATEGTYTKLLTKWVVLFRKQYFSLFCPQKEVKVCTVGFSGKNSRALPAPEINWASNIVKSLVLRLYFLTFDSSLKNPNIFLVFIGPCLRWPFLLRHPRCSSSTLLHIWCCYGLLPLARSPIDHSALTKFIG